MDTFSRSIQLTPATLQTILQTLEPLSSSGSSIDPCVLDITLYTLETAVSGASATSRLSASQNGAARASALEVLRTIANLVKKIASLPSADDSTRLRLLQLLIDLAKAQNKFAVLDEVPTLLSANDILLVTGNLSSSALSRSNISLGDVTVILSLVNSSDRVDLSLVRWINSTFPLSVLTGQVIGSTVITTVSTGGQVGTITIIFGASEAKPADPTSVQQTPVSCGVYNSATKRFDSTGCSLEARQGGSYACTCSRTGSLALLFSLDGGPNGGATAPGLLNVGGPNVVGIAVGVTLAILVIIGAVIAVYIFRKRIFERTERRKFRVAQEKYLPNQATATLSASTPPPSPPVARGWAVTKPSVTEEELITKDAE